MLGKLLLSVGSGIEQRVTLLHFYRSELRALCDCLGIHLVFSFMDFSHELAVLLNADNRSLTSLLHGDEVARLFNALAMSGRDTLNHRAHHLFALARHRYLALYSRSVASALLDASNASINVSQLLLLTHDDDLLLGEQRRFQRLYQLVDRIFVQPVSCCHKVDLLLEQLFLLDCLSRCNAKRHIGIARQPDSFSD